MESKIEITKVDIPETIEVNWVDTLGTVTIGGEPYLDSSQKFVDFCSHVKVVHPIKGIIPFEVYEYLKNLVRMMEGSDRYIIGTKFRRGWFTTTLALYALWKCISSAGQSIAIIAKSDRDATNIGQIINGVIDRLPDWLKIKIGKRNDHEVCFSNDSRMWFRTSEACRGCALNYLIIDEAAFIKDMDSGWKCSYPCISTGGKAIVISSINGTNGWFYKTYMDAVNRKNSFSIYRCNIFDHPEYSRSEWQDKVRSQVGSEVYQLS